MVEEILIEYVLPIVTPILSGLLGLLVVQLMRRVGVDMGEKNKAALERVIAQGINGTIQEYTEHIKRNRVDGMLTDEEKKKAMMSALNYAYDFAKEEGLKTVSKRLKDPETKKWIKGQVEAAYREIKTQYGTDNGNDKWAEAAKLGILMIWDDIAPKAAKNIEEGKFKVKDWEPLIKDVKEATLEFLSKEAIEHLNKIEKEGSEESKGHESAVSRLIFKQLILASRGQLEGVRVGS